MAVEGKSLKTHGLLPLIPAMVLCAVFAITYENFAQFLRELPPPWPLRMLQSKTDKVSCGKRTFMVAVAGLRRFCRTPQVGSSSLRKTYFYRDNRLRGALTTPRMEFLRRTPQSGFAKLIFRIRLRTSGGTVGRPGAAW